jgi:hypothetical protein
VHKFRINKFFKYKLMKLRIVYLSGKNKTLYSVVSH